MPSNPDRRPAAMQARENYAPTAKDQTWGLNGSWGLFYDEFDLEASEKNWDKVFPYQLLVLNENVDAKGASSYTIVQGEKNGELRFTLPMPPEALSITTPFAITGAVTQNGYVEQHGGAPIKMISLSGTTGVLLTRGSADKVENPTSIAQAIFAGTLQAASAFNKTIAGITGATTPRSNVYTADTFGDNPQQGMLSKSTGYYQFRLLQRFLEAYAALKRTSKGRTYRLAFAIWKDETIYLTTPQNFSLKRVAADSPLEYKYDFQLKAFARISPGVLGFSSGAQNAQVGSDRSPNTLADIYNRARAVREILQDASALIGAVSNDIQTAVLNVLREVLFGIKDAIGVAQTLIDMPHAIVRNVSTFVVQQWGEVNAAKLALQASAGNQSARFLDDLGLLDDAASTHSTQPLKTTSHPANEIFEHPNDHPEILNALNPSTLVLPDAVRRQIEIERQRVRDFTRRDYEQRRDALLQAAASYAIAVGASHPTFNSTYGLASAQATRRQPTDSDFDVLYALNEAAIVLSKLAARADITTPIVTPVEVIAGLASKSGMRFEVPRSKFTVPFLYGHSMEDMASIYLGDPNRWMEIAALNGLREPYVDEVGFLLPLLVNAHGNTVVVSDASNLYLGQAVWLESTLTPRQKRHIVSIEKVFDGLYTVVLDGDPVDVFTLAGASQLHAFLQHTVNSQMLIYIPSDQPSTDDPRTKQVPGVDDHDHLLKVGGIDWLLTPANDLVITPDGDGRWAFGLTNIVQQGRIILNTPRGSIKRHKSFGAGVTPGDTVARVSAKDLLADAREAFLQDPTYSGVERASVLVNGPLTRMVLQVGIAGTRQTVPIAVDVDRQSQSPT